MKTTDDMRSAADNDKCVSRKLCILIGSLVAFSNCVFAPVEYYFGNKDSMWCDLYNILPIVLPFFVGVFIIFAIVVLILSRWDRVLSVFVYIITALSIALYVQGNFIMVPYEEINGEQHDATVYSLYSWPSVCAWIGIAALVFLIFYSKKTNKKYKYITIILVCIFLNQVLCLTVSGIQNKGFKVKNDLMGITEGKWDYSADENLCILIIDTMDSRVFEQYLEECLDEEGREQLSNTLDGFTYYRDTLGAFTLTDYAVPHIITGKPYLGDMRYYDYIEQAYADSPLLHRLKSENWSVNVHAYSKMPQKEGAQLIDNLGHVRYKCSDYGSLFKNYYRLVFFRYAPTPLKKYLYCDASVLDYSCTLDSIDGKTYTRSNEYDYGTDEYWGNEIFYYGTEELNSSAVQKTLQVYHIKGIHALRDMDENFEVIYNPNEYLSLRDETKVVAKTVETWLNKLKEENLYDNSSIVIMADHGSSKYTAAHNYGQTPLLMIKGKNEKHPLTVSQIPISYWDLQDIYSALIDGEQGSQIVKTAFGNDIESMNEFGSFDVEKFIKNKDSEDGNYDKVGRRRNIIIHYWEGNLGETNNGDEGIELCTEYPSYDGGRFEKVE